MDSKGLTEEQCLQFVKDMVEFPYQQICRHYVASKLLSLMESNGFHLTNELAHAIVGCHDAEALHILNTDYNL